MFGFILFYFIFDSWENKVNQYVDLMIFVPLISNIS